MVYSRPESVFVLEYYFASQPFAAVREALSSAYPDRVKPSEMTIDRLVTKLRDTGRVRVSSGRRRISADKLFFEFLLTNKK